MTFEALEALEDAQAETGMPIDVVAWANEEGSRFAPGVMGSMAFTGADTAAWKSIVGADGVSLATEFEATIAALPGGSPDRHADIRLYRAAYRTGTIA